MAASDGRWPGVSGRADEQNAAQSSHQCEKEKEPKKLNGRKTAPVWRCFSTVGCQYRAGG
eukprot:scaffold165832_cov26-Tisochrysis_lutea.AAC.1